MKKCESHPPKGGFLIPEKVNLFTKGMRVPAEEKHPHLGVHSSYLYWYTLYMKGFFRPNAAPQIKTSAFVFNPPARDPFYREDHPKQPNYVITTASGKKIGR